MQERTIVERVEILEKNLDMQETLPARMSAVEARLGTVEAQIVHLRREMRDEFSALEARLIAHAREGDTGTRHQIEALEQRLVANIGEGDEDTRRYMRVLHEDVIARIATLGQHRRRR